VALNDGNGGAQVLDLGFELVGAATRGGEFEARFFGVEPEALEGVTPIGEHFEENVEAIAALQPDLIVGYAFDGEPAHERIERFEAIAPFAMIATFEPVDRVMRRFAELLGVEAQAAEREAGYVRRVEALREAMPVPPSEVTATSIYHFGGDGHIRVNGPDISPLEATLEAVGVRFSPVTPAEGQRAVSFERIGRLDADLIFHLFDPEPPAPAMRLYERLDAVREGRAHAHDNFPRTYSGQEGALDFLQPILTDPALAEAAPG
jgi:iron complex transport system substrate-binding protein